LFEQLSPIYKWTAGGHAAACVVLAEAGANLDIADKHGWTPIAHADFKGHQPAAYLHSARAKRVVQQMCDALENEETNL
jgi:ankyrin repeat protein